MLKKYISRRRLFVDRTVQGSLLASLLIQWAIFLCLVFAFSFAIQLYNNSGNKTLIELACKSLQQQSAAFIVAAVVVPYFFRNTLLMSNRFAGPIHRMRKSIRDLAETGTCDDISFRSEDYWNELTHEFNQLRAEYLIVQQALEQRKISDQHPPKRVSVTV